MSFTVFSPTLTEVVAQPARSAWNLNSDETGPRLSGSSNSTFFEIQQLPKEAKIPILQFILQKISSSWAIEHDIPIKMKRLAEVLSTDIYKSHWEEKLLDLKEEKYEKGSEETNGEGPYGTILHIACVVGDLWLAAMQLKAGVDVNAIDTHGWTAVMVAQAQGNLACTKLLRKVVSTSEVESVPDVFRPSSLVDSDVNGLLKLCTDKVTIKSVKSFGRYQSYPQVCSDHPIPPMSSFYYYEITIINSGPNRYVAHYDLRPSSSYYLTLA